MKKVVLLGASGPTGLEVIKFALQNEYEIRAVVRDPSKITTKHANLKVFRANVFEESSLVPIMEGSDAVVSCLGAMPGLTTVTLYSEATAAVVQAMRQTGVQRLVVMSAAFCKDEPSHPFWWRWGVRLILGRLLDDIVRMETYLQEHCADIHYTSVRPPQLTNKPLSEQEVKTEEAYFVAGGEYNIPRADVARFMLGALDQEQYYKKCIAIAL